MEQSRKVDPPKVAGGIVIGILAFVVVALFGTGSIGPANLAARLWTAGAMGLGLAVGLTTGISKKDGNAQEFMKFVSGGVIIPILGGIGAFLVKEEEVKVTSTYDGTQLIEQTTTTVTSFPNDLLHPFAVLGLFFVGFALFAVLGIATGTLLREGGIVVQAV